MSLSQFLLNLFFPQKCPLCGKLPERVEAGICPRCLEESFGPSAPKEPFPGENYVRCVCAGWYRDKLREGMLRFKFEGRPEYAEAFGPLLAKTVRFYLPGSYDCISWMPVSPETLKTRRYDQAELLARETAKALGQEAVPLLSKTGKNVPQSSLEDGRQRKSNVSGVYTVPDPARVSGQRILLIDDILTTGSTLEEGAKTLRQAGAAQVVCAALCRTPKHH